MKLTNINFIFGNCESIEIDGKYIGEFTVDNITTAIQRIACNSIEELRTAKTIAVEIHKEANKPVFRSNQEQMTFDRFMDYRDITSIEFDLFDEINSVTRHYDYYVDWCGNSDFENTAQSVYVSKPGNLYLLINSKTNVLQFFDADTIDDEEYMKFKFNMYGVEEYTDG